MYEPMDLRALAETLEQEMPGVFRGEPPPEMEPSTCLPPVAQVKRESLRMVLERGGDPDDRSVRDLIRDVVGPKKKQVGRKKKKKTKPTQAMLPGVEQVAYESRKMMRARGGDPDD